MNLTVTPEQHASNVATVRSLLERTGNQDLSAILGLDEPFQHTAPVRYGRTPAPRNASRPSPMGRRP